MNTKIDEKEYRGIVKKFEIDGGIEDSLNSTGYCALVGMDTAFYPKLDLVPFEAIKLLGEGNDFFVRVVGAQFNIKRNERHFICSCLKIIDK